MTDWQGKGLKDAGVNALADVVSNSCFLGLSLNNNGISSVRAADVAARDATRGGLPTGATLAQGGSNYLVGQLSNRFCSRRAYTQFPHC